MIIRYSKNGLFAAILVLYGFCFAENVDAAEEWIYEDPVILNGYTTNAANGAAGQNGTEQSPAGTAGGDGEDGKSIVISAPVVELKGIWNLSGGHGGNGGHGFSNTIGFSGGSGGEGGDAGDGGTLTIFAQEVIFHETFEFHSNGGNGGAGGIGGYSQGLCFSTHGTAGDGGDGGNGGGAGHIYICASGISLPGGASISTYNWEGSTCPGTGGNGGAGGSIEVHTEDTGVGAPGDGGDGGNEGGFLCPLPTDPPDSSHYITIVPPSCSPNIGFGGAGGGAILCTEPPTGVSGSSGLNGMGAPACDGTPHFLPVCVHGTCESAAIITGDTPPISGALTRFMPVGGQTSCDAGDPERWFEMTIEEPGTLVTVDFAHGSTHGSVSLFTNGCGSEEFQHIVCSSSSEQFGSTSALMYTSEPDQNIFIKIAAPYMFEQTFEVNCISEAPSNQNLESAYEIHCGQGYSEFGPITTFANSTQVPSPPSCGHGNVSDVWFKYNAPPGYPHPIDDQPFGPEITIDFTDDPYYATTSGNKHAGFIALYKINPWTNLLELVDFRCSRLYNNFYMTVKLGSSTTYYIRLGSTSPSPHKSFSMSCNSKLP